MHSESAKGVRGRVADCRAGWVPHAHFGGLDRRAAGGVRHRSGEIRVCRVAIGCRCRRCHGRAFRRSAREMNGDGNDDQGERENPAQKRAVSHRCSEGQGSAGHTRDGRPRCVSSLMLWPEYRRLPWNSTRGLHHHTAGHGQTMSGSSLASWRLSMIGVGRGTSPAVGRRCTGWRPGKPHPALPSPTSSLE